MHSSTKDLMVAFFSDSETPNVSSKSARIFFIDTLRRSAPFIFAWTAFLSASSVGTTPFFTSSSSSTSGSSASSCFSSTSSSFASSAASSSSSSFSSYSASSDRADVAPSSGIERRLNTYRETQRTRRAVPEGAPHHPRVSIPRSLSDHLIRARPFSAPLEPITPEDAATMLRQTRKHRAYPLAACHRCKHGYPQAYLHAPMHIPAATELASEGLEPAAADSTADRIGAATDWPGGIELAGSSGSPARSPSRSRGSALRAKARKHEESPAKGAQAEHALGWLACPLLTRHVDALESRGGIGAMAVVVAGVPSLATALERVHESAPATRRWLLPPAWVQRVETLDALKGARHILFRTGLIGVSLDRARGSGNGGRLTLASSSRLSAQHPISGDVGRGDHGAGSRTTSGGGGSDGGSGDEARAA
eukprot:CAMPEP_0181363154 /NCGR_PEP_ID=MMETSP1106-20121128/8527_1 /TAXON_ID=81844 /ORGANISM="Mantoniella antarctica, Strain SL-175" /LENGTH=421 /DNA_ID=CAMNT_0023477433 /DNA_START=94 /DNA_END=1356 /DNA_ORIENTATION=+